MYKLIIVLQVLICVLLTEGSNFKMPSFSFIGESVRMECHVDHGDLPILSITWSKDGQPFYKYDPNKPDPVELTNLKGVLVKKDLSMTGNIITLSSVTSESSGEYACTVEIDHASLDRGKLSGSLKVVPN